MKLLKKIGLVILVLVAIPLIIALFVNKEYAIERSVVINKPVADVFNYVRLLRNQDYYSKWVMTDPNMKKYYRGTDGTTGFVYGWNGNKQAGEGEEEIKELVENEKVNIEVRFKRPMESVAYTPIYTKAVDSSKTEVKWGISGKSNYPMNFMNLFMDGLLGQDVETSLNTLKGILEK